MCLGQHTHFDVDLADRPGVTAVNSRLSLDDRATDCLLLKRAERTVDVISHCLFCFQRCDGLVTQLTQATLTLHLVSDLVGFSNVVPETFANSFEQCCVLGRRLPVPSRLARFSFELVYRCNDDLHFLVGKQHGAEHLIFRKLVRFGLNHEYGGFCAGNDHVEVRRFQRFISWVQQVAFRCEANTGSTNRAGKRNT